MTKSETIKNLNILIEFFEQFNAHLDKREELYEKTIRN